MSLMAQSVWDFFAGNWALVSIVTTLILLVLIPTLIVNKYVHICFNIFDTVPPLAVGLRHVGPMPGETVDFRALDGHALRGTLIPANLDQPWRGLVIFAHEFSSDRTSCMRYCRSLLDAGYEVFAFDFRGHGISGAEEGYKPRQWPTDREHADMVGAIAFVEDYLERHEKSPAIGLLGISRGAGAAILASVGVPQVRAIVTDGAFSTDSTLEYFMKKFAGIFAKVRFMYENHPPEVWRFLRWRVMGRAARRYGCTFPSVRKALVKLTHTPIFMIHGQKDGYIPLSQTQYLYDLASEPKYIWLVPEAKHNCSVLLQPELYADKLLRFFNEHLAVVPAPMPDLPRGVQPESTPTASQQAQGLLKLKV